MSASFDPSNAGQKAIRDSLHQADRALARSRPGRKLEKPSARMATRAPGKNGRRNWRCIVRFQVQARGFRTKA